MPIEGNWYSLLDNLNSYLISLSDSWNGLLSIYKISYAWLENGYTQSRKSKSINVGHLSGYIWSYIKRKMATQSRKSKQYQCWKIDAQGMHTATYFWCSVLIIIIVLLLPYMRCFYPKRYSVNTVTVNTSTKTLNCAPRVLPVCKPTNRKHDQPNILYPVYVCRCLQGPLKLVERINFYLICRKFVSKSIILL